MEGSGTNEGHHGVPIPSYQQIQQQQQQQQQQMQQQQHAYPAQMMVPGYTPQVMQFPVGVVSGSQPSMQQRAPSSTAVLPRQNPEQETAINVPPLPTSHVKLPKAITIGHSVAGQKPTIVEVIYFQFFRSHPDMWVKFNTDYDTYCKEIFSAYLTWGKMVKEQGERAKEERKKRIRESETARGRLQQRVRARYMEAERLVRRDWPNIHEPKTDDEKKFLPHARASHLVSRCCGPDVKLTQHAELALELLSKHFVEEAVSFGVAMARRRPKTGVQEIQADDISLFLKTSWNIMVPSHDGVVKGYSVNVPKANYKNIEAATRKENLIEGRPLFNAIEGKK